MAVRQFHFFGSRLPSSPTGSAVLGALGSLMAAEVQTKQEMGTPSRSAGLAA